MEHVQLKKIVEKIQKLPTLPVVVTQVMRMVEDSATTAADINRIISNDPSLSSKILKLVNSAFYGFPRRISTVTQAIVILGFNTVKSLALSASVFDVFKGKGSSFDRTAFWQHSIAVGVCSQIISKKVHYSKPEESFIAGILHDIGKIALDQYAHEDFEEVLKTAESTNCSVIEAERKVLGATHAQVGRWMALKWNFPDNLLEPIAFHHSPQSAKTSPELASMVHLSDILVKTMGIGSGGDNTVPALDPAAWRLLQLEKKDLENIMEELKNSIDKASAFLALAQQA